MRLAELYKRGYFLNLSQALRAFWIKIIPSLSPRMLSDMTRGMRMNGWVSSKQAYVRPRLGSLWSSATIYFYSEIEIRCQLTPSGGYIGGLLESPQSKTKISLSTSWSVRRFFWIWAGTTTSVSIRFCFSYFLFARLLRWWCTFLVQGSSK